MRQETEKMISEFLIVIFFYFISLIVSGSYRINNVLEILDSEIIKSAKLSGYASLITSSLFSSTVIIIIFFIAYFSIQIFNLKIDTKSLINGLITSVYILIIFEIVRVVLALFLFEDAVYKIVSSEGIIESLKNSEWYFYDDIIKILMILSTGIVFGIEIIEKNKNYLDVIILSIIIPLGFYISTINIFSTI
jgi:hypothetical protein